MTREELAKLASETATYQALSEGLVKKGGVNGQPTGQRPPPPPAQPPAKVPVARKED